LPEVDAVTLFVERARAIDPAFEPSAAVAEICRRLDGLPLALELAAARVGVLSPADLLARLQRALPVLTLGSRDAPERQRTLRATMTWSHELLDDAERRLFRWLAVFSASFELEAVEAVCEAELDTLQSLVDKSLVRRWGSGRFGLLETVQEYADERLAAAGEADEVTRRHAEYYLAVAKSANLADDAEGGQRHDIATREQDNFRRALAWAVQGGDVELALRLAVALESFWVASSPFEGMRWFQALLERAVDVPQELLARALLAYGGVVFIVGEFARGTRLYEQSLAIYRALGDERGSAHVLHRLAVSAIVEKDVARARALAEESLELHRRFGSRRGEAIALGTLGELEWRAGRRELALELEKESAAIAGEAGFVWWQVATLYYLCEWSLELGRPGEAEPFGCEALELAHRAGDRMHAVYLLALLARMAAEDARLERAGLLWGALEAEEKRGPIGQWEAEREGYAAPVLARAGPDLERGREEGRRLSLEEAVRRALSAGPFQR
jgi:tetratricopeptide (TPR) repeat protein